MDLLERLIRAMVIGLVVGLVVLLILVVISALLPGVTINASFWATVLGLLAAAYFMLTGNTLFR